MQVAMSSEDPELIKPQLPNGWIVRQSLSYPDRVYYFNTQSGASTWEVPELCKFNNGTDPSKTVIDSLRAEPTSTSEKDMKIHSARMPRGKMSGHFAEYAGPVETQWARRHETYVNQQRISSDYRSTPSVHSDVPPLLGSSRCRIRDRRHINTRDKPYIYRDTTRGPHLFSSNNYIENKRNFHMAPPTDGSVSTRDQKYGSLWRNNGSNDKTSRSISSFYKDRTDRVTGSPADRRGHPTRCTSYKSDHSPSVTSENRKRSGLSHVDYLAEPVSSAYNDISPAKRKKSDVLLPPKSVYRTRFADSANSKPLETDDAYSSKRNLSHRQISAKPEFAKNKMTDNMPASRSSVGIVGNNRVSGMKPGEICMNKNVHSYQNKSIAENPKLSKWRNRKQMRHKRKLARKANINCTPCVDDTLNKKLVEDERHDIRDGTNYRHVKKQGSEDNVKSDVRGNPNNTSWSVVSDIKARPCQKSVVRTENGVRNSGFINTRHQSVERKNVELVRDFASGSNGCDRLSSSNVQGQPVGDEGCMEQVMANPATRECSAMRKSRSSGTDSCGKTSVFKANTQGLSVGKAVNRNLGHGENHVRVSEMIGRHTGGTGAGRGCGDGLGTLGGRGTGGGRGTTTAAVHVTPVVSHAIPIRTTHSPVSNAMSCVPGVKSFLAGDNTIGSRALPTHVKSQMTTSNTSKGPQGHPRQRVNDDNSTTSLHTSTMPRDRGSTPCTRTSNKMKDPRISPVNQFASTRQNSAKEVAVSSQNIDESVDCGLANSDLSPKAYQSTSCHQEGVHHSYLSRNLPPKPRNNQRSNYISLNQYLSLNRPPNLPNQTSSHQNVTLTRDSMTESSVHQERSLNRPPKMQIQTSHENVPLTRDSLTESSVPRDRSLNRPPKMQIQTSHENVTFTRDSLTESSFHHDRSLNGPPKMQIQTSHENVTFTRDNLTESSFHHDRSLNGPPKMQIQTSHENVPLMRDSLTESSVQHDRSLNQSPSTRHQNIGQWSATVKRDMHDANQQKSTDDDGATQLSTSAGQVTIRQPTSTSLVSSKQDDIPDSSLDDSMDVEMLDEADECADTCDEPHLKTLYIIADTCVLVGNLSAVKSLRHISVPGYRPPVIVIPWVVLQELDSLKKHKDSQGKFVNAAVRYINSSLSDQSSGIIQGQSVIEAMAARQQFRAACNDDFILQCCLQWAHKHRDSVCGLLSDDINLRNKALVSQITAISSQDLKEGVLKLPTTPGPLPSSPSHPVTLDDSLCDLDPKLETIVVEELVPQIKSLLQLVLGSILEFQMVATFDNLWMDVVVKKPPWTLDALLQCYKKHWMTTFSEVLPSDFQVALNELSPLLTSHQQDSKEYLNKMLIISEYIFWELQETQRFTSCGVDEALERVRQLRDRAIGTDRVTTCDQGPTSDLINRALTTTPQSTPVTETSSGVSPASHLSPDSTTPPDSPSLIQLKFQCVWEFVHNYTNSLRSVIDNGETKGHLESINASLETMVSTLKVLKFAFSRCLQLDKRFLSTYDSQFTELASVLNSFFSRLSQEDPSPVICHQQLQTFFGPKTHRKLLRNGLVQLTDMMKSLHSSIQDLPLVQ